MLHIISEVAPSLPVFFLDTGFHFTETLKYRDQLVETLKLNLNIIKPEIGHNTFKRVHGELYRQDPDMCCFINKVEPLNLAKEEYTAWISGIRRDQTLERSTTRIIEKQANNQHKICPMVNWKEKDIWHYISKYQLPEHPLLAQGFMSIGCAPCTRPTLAGEDSRSGRWSGQVKTECGLHTKS